MTGYSAIALTGLIKRYDAVVAVDDVSLSIGAGEILGLVGENGAGKSTLISLATGAQAPDDGEIRIGGLPHRSLTPGQAASLGIVAIRQEPVLVPALSVTENLLLGREPRRLGVLNRRAARRIAEEWLGRVDARVSPDATVGDLAPADRQLVEIARAVGPGARVVFFDEPTAVLGPPETERLFELIRRLAAEGTSVVYVSHRIEEIFAICRRVVVMRDGRLVGDAAIEDVDEARLVSLMAGRELAAELGRHHEAPERTAAACLITEGLTVGRRVREVDLEVRPGEIHGIAGIVGSGRTSLVEALAGVLSPTSGRMELDGRVYRPKSPRSALQAGVTLVPEDRLRDALFADLTIATNTVLPKIDRVARLGFVTRSREADASVRLLDRLSVRPKRPGVPGRALSGGNQQKVILARALFSEARVLILDEPTRGIDVGTKADIHALLRELAAAGLAVVLVSSDLRELLALADRVTVLARGRVTGRFAAPLDGERIMAAATGAAA